MRRWWVCDPGIKVFMTLLLDCGCVVEIGGHALHNRVRRRHVLMKELQACEKNLRETSKALAQKATTTEAAAADAAAAAAAKQPAKRHKASQGSAGAAAPAAKSAEAEVAALAARSATALEQANNMQKRRLTTQRNMAGDVEALHDIAVHLITAFGFGILPRLDLGPMVRRRAGGRGMDGASKNAASSLRRADFLTQLALRCSRNGCVITEGTEAFSTVVCSCCAKRSTVKRERVFRCSNQYCSGDGPLRYVAAGRKGGRGGRAADYLS